MRSLKRVEGLALLCALLLAGCSGGDNPTAPAEEPSVLGSTHSSFNYTVAEQAVTLPDRETVVLTNNSDDTLQCRISHAQDWLVTTRTSFSLLPDSSTSCDVRITIDTLGVGTYRDTIWIRDSETDEMVRRIPVKLRVVKNETYLEVDNPAMSYQYQGLQDGYHWYSMECSWKMICHSNGGNPCKVFQYVAVGGNAYEQNVNVLVRPDLPTGQQVTGGMSFYLITDHAPPLLTSFYVSVGYTALDKEYWLHIDFSS
ncbi:MAG: hypothetical protein ABIJ61_09670 [bacterium]